MTASTWSDIAPAWDAVVDRAPILAAISDRGYGLQFLFMYWSMLAGVTSSKGT